MHYIKDYSKLEGPAKKDQAIQDIKDYLGEEKFNEVEGILKAGPMLSKEDFFMNLSVFLGIEGYPAEAWADRLGLQ